MSRPSNNLRDLADIARNHIHQAFQNSGRRVSSTEDGSPHEDNRLKVAQVLEQVFQTLFAPCVNLHTDTNAGHKYQPKQGQHNYPQEDPFLYQNETDPYYAQFFNTSANPGDHGRTARAILLARQQEEFAQGIDGTDRFAPGSAKDRFSGRGWEKGTTATPLAKNIHVPTKPAWGDEFFEDDGVSALSAHTLEDMARLHMTLEEAVLRKKGGQHGIHVKATMMHPDEDPPSPASTENSEQSQQRDTTVKRGVKASSFQTDAEDWLDVGPTRYHPSNNNMTQPYPTQEQMQYHTHGRASGEIQGRLEEKSSRKSAGQMLNMQHPHDTLMAISAHDVVPKRNKKNSASIHRKMDFEKSTDVAEI